MTLEEYNQITELRKQGLKWEDLKKEIGYDKSHLTLKNNYNRAKKKYSSVNDIPYHTPIETEEIQLLKEAEPKEVIHHNTFSIGDLDTLKEMIAEYREKKTARKEEIEVIDWGLPSEFKKEKNTQVSIRLNKKLFDKLKREVHRKDKDIKVAEIVNKAMCDLLYTLKGDS